MSLPGTLLPSQPRRATSGFRGKSSRAAEISRRQSLDPQETLAESKSRNAAVSCLAELCYSPGSRPSLALVGGTVMQTLHSRRDFLACASLAGAASLLGGDECFAQEAPPETTTVRIPKLSFATLRPTSPMNCCAPKASRIFSMYR